MSFPATIVSSIRARVSDRKARRGRDNLISKIGELTYAQRTETAISYETEIAALVEEIRHLERTEDLRHRSDIADSDS